MGHVYEVVINQVQNNIPIANVFHVWDGAEDNTSQQILDAFKNNYIIDAKALQVNDLAYTRIAVTPLDVGNGKAPALENLTDVGAVGTEAMPNGIHIWAKLSSDDNGFKAGGKMIPGIPEAVVDNGQVIAAQLALWQTVYDDLLTDLVAAGVTLAIYRPSLSTPGFPSISTCSSVTVRGNSTNNRREQPFQA